MGTGNNKAGKCEIRANQSIILSAELEREMADFLKAAKPKSNFTPEMDAVIMRLYVTLEARDVANFINKKYGKTIKGCQIRNRYQVIRGK
jgi:hypothetical protein